MHPGFQETRDALLRAGVIALTEKGFSTTGVDEILTAVGVPKGSFYHYFPSKEAFGAELIARYADLFARRLDRFLQDERLTPVDRLRAFVRDAQMSMARHQYRRGCLVGNLGQEMNALPAAFRGQLIAVLEDWQARTARCLRAAQKAGSPVGHDCGRLAAFFWVGWEGAVLRAKLERNEVPLVTFAAFFFSLLEP